MSITDAHFHVWRQADLPWLVGPMQPRIFGPYEAIRRDYTISNYLADITDTGVSKAVYVQANWPVNKAIEEAEWIASLSAETGWPHALVAYADMTDPNVAHTLDRLAKISLVRGIRHQFHWHETPEYRFAPHDDLCRDATVQKNINRLPDYGFGFDLQVFAPQMAGAAEACAGLPENDICSPTRRHARRQQRTQPRSMAECHENACVRTQRYCQALGLWHVHPPLRSVACRLANGRNAQTLWPTTLPLGLELSDRKALDRLRAATVRTPDRR